MGEEKIKNDITHFVSIFNTEYKKLGPKYLAERRLIGWDMVAEENHSIGFDDPKLTEDILNLAAQMNTDYEREKYNYIKAAWFTPYFHVGEKNASVNL